MNCFSIIQYGGDLGIHFSLVSTVTRPFLYSSPRTRGIHGDVGAFGSGTVTIGVDESLIAYSCSYILYSESFHRPIN